MGTKYALTVENKSLTSGSICLYQTMPEQNNDIFSLAWYTKTAHPNTKVKFTWELNYCAFWSETGVLTNNGTFDASEIRDVDPSDPSNNSFVLTMKNGGYTFIKADKPAEKGTIGIFCDSTIPNRGASIGFGIDGQAAFATQALINMNFTFIPKVKYWLVFGGYEQGQVMDLSRLSNAVEVRFPPNVYQLQAILDENNQWTIE